MSSIPSIATSVRYVRVNLAFYAEDLAQSWSAFADYRVEVLGGIEQTFQSLLADVKKDKVHADKLRELVREIGANASSHNIYDFSASQAREARYEEMADSCHEVCMKEEEDDTVLKSAWHAYKRRWLSQKQALDSNDREDFARTVAKCVARMPKMAGLEISDLDIDLGWQYHEDTENSLHQHAIAPMRWEKYDMLCNTIEDCRADEVPVAILLSLPLELAKAGIALKKLSISVSVPEHLDWDKLKFDKEATTALANLVGGLKQLEISWWSPDHDFAGCREPGDVATYQKEMEAAADFISQVLSLSPSLEELRLSGKAFDFSPWDWGEEDRDNILQQPTPLASRIEISPLAQLRRLELDHFNTNVQPLEKLIGNHPVPVTVRLDNLTILKPENLHAALNMLRSKADPNQQQLGDSTYSPIYVESLFGVQDSAYMISRDSRDLNTGNSRFIEDYEKSPPSQVIEYVRWHLDRNPVSDRPPPSCIQMQQASKFQAFHGLR